MISSNSNIASSTTNITTHKKSRSTKPKVFECTGFGDCHMVFTRSEHLARHVRKHTGEKPFECVVPGCSRKFSRFDNMMQHTQTHRARHEETTSPSPITSPASLVFEPESSPEYFTAESSIAADSSDEEEVLRTSSSLYHHQAPLSVNQLCCNNNEHPPLLNELHLTQDEFEALQGFGRFKQTPIFIDSFRSLAAVVYIEPNPSRS